MKRLLLLLLILFAMPAYAEDVQLARLSPAMVGGGVPAAGGDTYEDLLFFWTCNSATFGADDYPSAYAGYSNGGTSPSYSTGQVGNALVIGEWDEVSLAVTAADIFESGSFRIGFWWFPVERSDDIPIIYITCATDTSYILYHRTTDEIGLEIWWGADGNGVTTTDANFALNTTWYFIELIFDDTSNLLQIKVDGTSKISNTTARSAAGAASSILLYAQTHDVANGKFDNFMISNDITRDLYLLRNLTTSPR